MPSLTTTDVVLGDGCTFPVTVEVTYDKVNVTAKPSRALTSEDIFTISCKIGYHPSGYGPIHAVHIDPATHVTTWKLYPCCD